MAGSEVGTLLDRVVVGDPMGLVLDHCQVGLAVIFIIPQSFRDVTPMEKAPSPQSGLGLRWVLPINNISAPSRLIRYVGQWPVRSLAPYPPAHPAQRAREGALIESTGQSVT
jgi:hypothetical protein